MKLRRAPTSSAPKTRQKEDRDEVEPLKYGNDKNVDDTEESVSFGNILPFSPMSVNSVSEVDEDTIDEINLKPKDSKPKKNMKKNPRKCKAKSTRVINDSSSEDSCTDIKNTPKRKSKSTRVINDSSSEDSCTDTELEVVIDDDKINCVKEVLSKLPEIIAKKYCKYIHDLQIRNQIGDTNNEELETKKGKLSSTEPFETNIKGQKGSRSTRGKKSSKQKSKKKSEGHQCPYCNLVFQKIPELRRHSKIHTDGNTYYCTICEKGFNKARIFMEHVNGHTGISPYQCQQCEKKYRSFSSLKEHEKYHQGTSPFQCTVCNKRFVSEKYLKVHVLIHGEEKKYQCEICGKRFYWPTELSRHRARHLNISYKCDDCGARFYHKSDVGKHWKQKHYVAPQVPKQVKAPEQINIQMVKKSCDAALRLESSGVEVNKQPLFLDKSLFSGLDIENDSEGESDSSSSGNE